MPPTPCMLMFGSTFCKCMLAPRGELLARSPAYTQVDDKVKGIKSYPSSMLGNPENQHCQRGPFCDFIPASATRPCACVTKLVIVTP